MIVFRRRHNNEFSVNEFGWPVRFWELFKLFNGHANSFRCCHFLYPDIKSSSNRIISTIRFDSTPFSSLFILLSAPPRPAPRTDYALR
jgi:hypothetical protein